MIRKNLKVTLFDGGGIPLISHVFVLDEFIERGLFDESERLPSIQVTWELTEVTMKARVKGLDNPQSILPLTERYPFIKEM